MRQHGKAGLFLSTTYVFLLLNTCAVCTCLNKSSTFIAVVVHVVDDEPLLVWSREAWQCADCRCQQARFRFDSVGDRTQSECHCEEDCGGVIEEADVGRGNTVTWQLPAGPLVAIRGELALNTLQVQRNQNATYLFLQAVAQGYYYFNLLSTCVTIRAYRRLLLAEIQHEANES